MSRRNLVLAVAVTAVISSLLTYLVGASPDPSAVARCENGVAPPSAATHGPGQPPPEPGADLRTGAGDSQLGPHREPGARQSTSQQDGMPSGAAAADQAVAAYRKQQEWGERFSSLFNSGDGPGAGDVNATVESRFYLEEWNQPWAEDQERGIRALFNADELRGMDPVQVTCRSKNCQVVLAAANREEVRELSRKFMQAASRGDAGMKDKVVSFFPDPSTGRLVFYLSEGGNTDLFQ